MTTTEAWFGFGIDPVNEKLIAITAAATKKEAEEKCKIRLAEEPRCADVYSWKVFNLLTNEGAAELRARLRECKCSEAQTKDLLTKLSDSLRRNLLPEKGQP